MLNLWNKREADWMD